MRLTQVLLVAAASFLGASEALSMTTDSSQATIAQVTAPNGRGQQRLLRTHHDEDEDLEERSLSKADLKQLFKDKTTISGYAQSLGISDDLARAGTSTAAYHNLLAKPAYEKYVAYLNYVNKKKSNAKLGRIKIDD